MKRFKKIEYVNPQDEFPTFRYQSNRFEPFDKPRGSAGHCDWVISDRIFFGCVDTPRYVYVHTDLIGDFADLVPLLKQRVVLITGSSDWTVPNQMDKRARKFPQLRHGWSILTEHYNIIHWFAENLDTVHPKVSPMPIGMRNGGWGFVGDADKEVEKLLNLFDRSSVPFSARNITVLSMDIQREGEQWIDRAKARSACKISSFCKVGEMSHLFNQYILSSKFTLMVHGGGLDPCPKAFTAILLGSIPILEHSSVEDAYMQLPIVFVKNAISFLENQNNDSMKLLEYWSREFAPYYEKGSIFRKQTLFKLTTEYWFKKVRSAFEEAFATET